MQPVRMSLEEQEVHRQALRILNQHNIRYVVAGAVAIGHYTGLWRDTKDLDLFLVPSEVTNAMAVLAEHGYSVGVGASNWLAHAALGKYYVDLIYGFGGWRASIDEQWYDRGQPSSVLGQPVRVAPVEEMIWIKAYVAHRERFDGADILHMIRSCHDSIDWAHLLDRFEPCWQVLIFYVNLYQFAFPEDRSDFPAWFLHELEDRSRHVVHPSVSEPPVSRGTLLDRYSFLTDIREGLRDARVVWAIAQGWTPRDVELDRIEAEQMVKEGRVRPDRAA